VRSTTSDDASDASRFASAAASTDGTSRSLATVDVTSSASGSNPCRNGPSSPKKIIPVYSCGSRRQPGHVSIADAPRSTDTARSRSTDAGVASSLVSQVSRSLARCSNAAAEKSPKVE
jgi:hypothetical protein